MKIYQDKRIEVMRYIWILLILTNSLFSKEIENKQISIYGYVSHHVANSKKYNDGKDFYIIKPKKIGKKVLPWKMQLLFDPDKIKIKIREDNFYQMFKLTGHIVDSDYKKNLRFYTNKAFQIDTIQKITSKIKAKSKGDITKVKFMLRSNMFTVRQAQIKKIEQTYIKNIKMKVGNKVVLNMKISYYISENPLIKFVYYNKDANASILKLEYTDNKDIVRSNVKKIKGGKGRKRIVTPFVPSKSAKRYRVKSKAIKAMFGDVTLIEDGIELTCPRLAENGGSVPIGIKSNIDAKSVTLFSLGDSGDLEFTTQFISTPHTIIDYNFRIKMKNTYDVQVVIEAKDGKFYTVKQNIIVSIGGGN